MRALDINLRRLAAAVEVMHPTPEAEEYLGELCSVTFTEWVRGRPVSVTKTLYSKLYKTFPPGFLTFVVKQGENDGHDVTITDARIQPPIDFGCLDHLVPPLYDFQKKAVVAALTSTVGIVKASTGAGKSVIAAAICTAAPATQWLVMVHRDTLKRQLMESMEKSLPGQVGTIGKGNEFIDGRVIVTTFQSILRSVHAKDVYRRTTGLIVDECFVAGTMVGRTPIENIRVGDLVRSYDETTGSFVERQVVGTRRTVPSSLVKLTISGNHVVCTPNHTFLTTRGWVPAGKLRTGDEVLHDDTDEASLRSLRGANASENHLHEVRLVLPRLQDRPTRREATVHQDQVCSMLCSNGPYGKGDEEVTGSVRQVRSGLLQPGMLHRVEVRGHGETLEKYRPKDQERVGRGVFQTHDPQQSHVHARGQRKGSSILGDQGRLETTSQRWQRKGTLRTTATPIGSYWAQDGASSKALWAESPRSTDVLQGGSGLSGNKSGRRGGRRISSWGPPSPPGRKERGRPTYARVDRVEVLQPGSDGRYGGLCPDGFVYNFEVEGTHTYTVGDGLVVHNCHTTAAATFFHVAKQCKNTYFRIGLSATPLDRSDQKSILAVSQLGRVIFNITAEELINRGFLSKPDVKFVNFIHDDTYADFVKYNTVYSHGIIKNKKRNDLIVDMVEKANKPCICFFKNLNHGKYLLKLMNKRGIQAELVDGKLHNDVRSQTVADAKVGRVDVILASVVFNEGIDIPNLESVVVAAAGRSTIATLQRIGRGMRKTATKSVFQVWDINDLGAKWLSDHAERRALDMVRENHTVEYIDALT